MAAMLPVSLRVGESRPAVAQFGEQTSSIIAAATIYSYGPGYDPLGIGVNFNCLYVYFDATRTLRAKMVHVDKLDEYINACMTAVNPNDPALGKPLSLARSVADLGPGQNQSGKYPAAARWDWDPATGKQFIGIKCGDAWCQIGEPTAGVFNPPGAHVLPSTSTADERQVVHIKGWHDEQILAAPAAPGATEKLRPSGLRGTVIPAPDLGTQTKVSLTSPTAPPPRWTLVAYVALRDLSGDTEALAYYRKKFGFEPVDVGPLASLNQMHYCFGSQASCGIPETVSCGGWFKGLLNINRMWVKIVAPNGNVRHLCVTRRGHPTFPGLIPPTARWRWVIGDDTVWTYCVQGCCQTEGGGT
jgi:hypothetical protein